MIPLMMQQGYQARGWLGLTLGTRLWYAFYGSEEEDEGLFEKRVDGVVREIGDRGKADIQPRAHVTEVLFPARKPAPKPAAATPVGTWTPSMDAAPKTPALTPSSVDSSFSLNVQQSPSLIAPSSARGEVETFHAASLI